MIRGDWSINRLDNDTINKNFYDEMIGIFTTLMTNVILLNLIVAILGDSYEEIVTTIAEKSLREKNFIIMRTEVFGFWKRENKERYCLFWMDYLA